MSKSGGRKRIILLFFTETNELIKQDEEDNCFKLKIPFFNLSTASKEYEHVNNADSYDLHNSNSFKLTDNKFNKFSYICELSPRNLKVYFNNFKTEIASPIPESKVTPNNTFMSETLNQSEPSFKLTKTTKCNCKKSKCMKQYCECFVKRELCLNCNCNGCLNTYENLKKKNKKKEKQVTKVTCKCTKSNCNKKYCECFKAGGFCNENCRCLQCENVAKKRKLFNRTKINRKKRNCNFAMERISIHINQGEFNFDKRKIVG